MFCPQCGANNSKESKFCVKCGANIALAALPTIKQQHRFSPQLARYAGFEGRTISPYPPRYAGFWFRTLAAIIDSLLCQVAVIVLVLPLAISLGASMAGSSATEVEAAGEGLGFTVGVLVQWLWFTIAESSKWQASVGKKMLGLRVTDENRARIGFGKANVRYWSKFLSALILLIGFIMVAFTEKKQGLHDIMAGTLVVKTDD